jgi:hypothetical protein
MNTRAGILLCGLLFSAYAATAQGPEVTTWILNTTGATGYAGIPSNVQLVRYSDSNVYVSCTCVPGYDIGPWPGNPNIPTNQRFVFKITREPEANAGTPVTTPLGHIGVWSNGVSIFNAKDAHSYNNVDVWHQNAVAVEGPGFDDCLGHPAPGGEYHHHLNPRCLYDDTDSSHHSPIIGYAFDGYPIYGAYGFRETDGSGGVTRMRSSYRLRAIDDRSTLPDGTVLSSNQYGPAVTTQFPRGYYCEDFEYVPGLGDLDEHNGRFCVTPEYPQGTYAYFVTLDEKGDAAYPYTLGPAYYGVVTQVDIGPGSGHVTPSEPVQAWTASDVPFGVETSTMVAYPNPASQYLSVEVPADGKEWSVEMCDVEGNVAAEISSVRPSAVVTLPVDNMASGVYLIRVRSESATSSGLVIVAH